MLKDNSSNNTKEAKRKRLIKHISLILVTLLVIGGIIGVVVIVKNTADNDMHRYNINETMTRDGYYNMVVTDMKITSSLNGVSTEKLFVSIYVDFESIKNQKIKISSTKLGDYKPTKEKYFNNQLVENLSVKAGEKVSFIIVYEVEPTVSMKVLTLQGKKIVIGSITENEIIK